MKKEKLTYSDYNMFYYFYYEKGDLNRWCGWEERKKLFKKEHPEVFKTMKKIEEKKKLLHVLIENMMDNVEEENE